MRADAASTQEAPSAERAAVDVLSEVVRWQAGLIEELSRELEEKDEEVERLRRLLGEGE